MKRYSETVLNGHPDKFCDLLADRIIRYAYRTDPLAYAQVEVSIWSDQLFLTGAVVTRKKIETSLREMVTQLGFEIGYTPQNHIDVNHYHIEDHICWIIDDPEKYASYVNDQCIVTAYAGYDAKTRYLPPEHFGSWYFREQIIRAISSGPLQGHGPDGKVLLVMDENRDEWQIKTLLLTLQQQKEIPFTDFVMACNKALHDACLNLQKHDSRWEGSWNEMNVLVNPNGPLINAGSDGDNGQTGRKLVMDYYGPRIPLGGGALYGKDLAHIDRLAAFTARKYALELMHEGAKDALIEVCYAPGMNLPLDVSVKTDIRPQQDPYQYFNFDEMIRNMDISNLEYDMGGLGTFYNSGLSFNRQSTSVKNMRICE